MLTAIIEKGNNTLIMEFPCKRYLMADHLGSIGIRKPAHEIKCMDEEDEPIKVKIFGNSEFENKLASFISSADTLSLVNTMCEIYQNLPYQNKLDAMEAVITSKVASVAEFGRHMMIREQRDPDFLSGHCNFIGESDFNVNWCPDELFGWHPYCRPMRRR